jgi:hypothetical protein
MPDQYSMVGYYRPALDGLPGMRLVGKQLWSQSGTRPPDIQTAVLYDHFTPFTLIQLEEPGLCGWGEAKDFIADGAIEIGGRLPINTDGGQLGEAYIHGMNGIAEGLRRLRGTSVNQVPDVEHVLVTAGSGVLTSGLILGESEAQQIYPRVNPPSANVLRSTSDGRAALPKSQSSSYAADSLARVAANNPSRVASTSALMRPHIKLHNPRNEMDATENTPKSYYWYVIIHSSRVEASTDSARRQRHWDMVYLSSQSLPDYPQQVGCCDSGKPIALPPQVAKRSEDLKSSGGRRL